MPQGQGLYLVQGLLAMNAGHAWYQYPDPEMNNIRQKRLPKKLLQKITIQVATRAHADLWQASQPVAQAPGLRPASNGIKG